MDFKVWLDENERKAKLSPNEKEITVPSTDVDDTVQKLRDHGYTVLATSYPPRWLRDEERTIWYY